MYLYFELQYMACHIESWYRLFLQNTVMYMYARLLLPSDSPLQYFRNIASSDY